MADFAVVVGDLPGMVAAVATCVRESGVTVDDMSVMRPDQVEHDSIEIRISVTQVDSDVTEARLARTGWRVRRI